MNLYNYINYLEYLNKNLIEFFKNQAPYIFCNKGCARCCKKGIYPFSEIEFRYLMFGYKKLSSDLQYLIKNKILNLYEEKITSEGDNYMYECPFLINNECSLYDYRGIICRTFGLMTYQGDGIPKIPFCAFAGLNYSQVLDFKTQTVSFEKFSRLKGFPEPLAFNIDYKLLTNKEHEEICNISFGEQKSLLDWLILEFELQ